MAKIDVKVPSVGESVTEVTVGNFKVNTGAFVEEDSVICELESDKASVEVPAPKSGIITFTKKIGDTLSIGDVFAQIEISVKPLEEKKEEEKEDYVPLATPAQIMTPPLLQTETPVYATLPSQVYELFEKMIGLMMIQEYKGVSITTIKLSMPGSVFNGCEIKLEHYDTAPHAFNIQLLGNPDAVELFNANFDGLVNSFKQTKYSFQANVRRPVLLETYHSFSRKKGAGSNDNDNSSQSEHAS